MTTRHSDVYSRESECFATSVDFESDFSGSTVLLRMDPSSFIRSWSYLGIIGFLVLTGCGLPIPEEVPIIAAGLMSKSTLNPWLALASCFVGAIVGDMVMYGIGRKFGRRLLQRGGFFAGYLSPEREREIEEQFRLHGMKVLFVARFLAGVRSPIYLTAGILKVPFRRFVIADSLCASIVIPIFFGLAYLFSEQINEIWQALRQAEIAATTAVVCAAVVGLIFYRRVRRRSAAASEADSIAAESSNCREKVEKSVA